MDGKAQNKPKNTIGMWSALKGLLVVIIVLVHSVNDAGEICNRFVYPIPFRLLVKAGGILLFTLFMISGYLFKPVENSGIKKQYRSYIKIYLITIFLMVISAAINDGITGREKLYSWRILIGGLYGATDRLWLFGTKIHPPYAMWYFAVFMNSWLILELFMKIKNLKIRHTVIFGLPLLFFVIRIAAGRRGSYIFDRQPFYIVPTVIAAMLLYIGYLLKKEELLFRKIKWYRWCVILLIAAGVFIFGRIDMKNNEYRLNVLDCIGSILGAFVVMYCYIRIVNPDNRLLEPFMWIGRRSLLIIPIHSVEWALFLWLEWDGLRGLGIYMASLLIFFIRSCLIFLACIAIEWGQRKYRQYKYGIRRQEQ